MNDANDDCGYASRKFLLACAIVLISGTAMFTGHMTGSEALGGMMGAFVTFAGGDVAQNIARGRSATQGPAQ